MSEKKNAKFVSSWGFVLAAVGSAVGMANVWGFPAKMAAGGGFAFLIPYFIFIALFSAVGLSAEFAIGRWAKTGTLGSYKKAFANRNKKLGVAGEAVGWLPLIGSLGISLGYAVIISYLLKALFESVTGSLMRVEDVGTWFQSFSLQGYSVIPYHVIVIAVTLVTLLLGAKSIEKSNKVMMPVFFLIFVGLAVWVAFLPGASAGYRLMFTPVWSKLLDPNVWITAMGQAFFSLSVTGSGMLVYGAYLGEKESVVPLSIRTAIFDTIAALVAALVVIPACAAFGLPMGGPDMLFVAMPSIMKGMGLFGQILAIFLYVAMIFAGISSLQNMFEAVSESILNRFPKLKRWVVLTVLGLVCFGIGVNMEAISSWGPWMDLVSIYIIPIGATIGAITWFWIMRKNDFMAQINLGAKKPLGKGWYYSGKLIYAPCALILCLIALITKTAF